MHIKQVLESISKDLPTVFIIRHAKRFSTANIEEDFKCTLTPEGRGDAKQLGEIFANNVGQINKIVSSPVGRCIETASNIAKESASNIEVEQRQDLERAYAFEPTVAIEHFKQFPVRTVIKKLFLGESLEGIRSTDEGTILLLKNILMDLTGGKKTSLYVSHDSVLAMFFATLTGVPIYDHEELWFTYLDGVCLQLGKDNIMRLYRGNEVYHISEKLISFGLQGLDGTLTYGESVPKLLDDIHSHNPEKYIDGIFSNLKEGLPTAFIIRHAERFYADDPNQDHACELTAQGKIDAKKLGEVFLQRVEKFSQVFSSPADRCVETGRNTLIGEQNAINVQHSQYLAEAYVHNGQKAVKNFQLNTVPEIIRKQLLDNSLIGMRSKDEGTKLLLSAILPSLQSDAVTLYVTHDAVLGTFFGTLAEGHMYNNDALQFHFLDGICLQQEKTGDIILYRHDNVFNIATKITQLHSRSQSDVAFIFFTIKELIENAPTVKYFSAEIINPLVHPVIPQDFENIISMFGFFQANYLWVGAHLSTSLAAAFFFPNKDITLAVKFGAALSSSAIYFAKVEVFDYLNQLHVAKTHHNIDELSINNASDFLSHCNKEIIAYNFLGFFNSITNKLLIPNLSNSLLFFDAFNNAAISGLQCYVYHKDMVRETPKSFVETTIPYLMDAMYIYFNMKQSASMSFNSFHEGFFSVKKGIMLLSGLVLTDYLTKVTLTVVSEEIKEQYIGAPVDYVYEKYQQFHNCSIEMFQDGVEYLHHYFTQADEIKEEL